MPKANSCIGRNAVKNRPIIVLIAPAGAVGGG